MTVHESPITVNGWQGSGYSILDRDYGVGAYKISGGSSGGEAAGDIPEVNLLSLLGIGSANAATNDPVGKVSNALLVLEVFDFFFDCDTMSFESRAVAAALVVAISIMIGLMFYYIIGYFALKAGLALAHEFSIVMSTVVSAIGVPSQWGQVKKLMGCL